MKKMLKLLTMAVVMGMGLAASAATFLDKTSLDQLGYRTLGAGQIAWNEEDGSCVLYVGSPSEAKNLKVVDPAALRGYRYKVIDQELTFNCSDNMTDLGNGTFQWNATAATMTAASRKYMYKQITTKTKVPANNNGVWTQLGQGSFPYNADNAICTLDIATGEYTPVVLPTDYEIDPESLDGMVYYKKIGYWEASVEIISKDSAIQMLDYTYSESTGGVGDMNPITTERECIYDGRKATVIIKIIQTSGTGKFAKVTGFTARCMGVGDIDDYTNDLTDGMYVKIKDKEGTYQLNNLRYELYHKYDGNRGVDWSKYPAYQTARMVDNAMTWSYTWEDKDNPDHKETSNYAIGLTGEKKDQFAFGAGSINFMRYVPGSADAGDVYAGTQIQITAWEKNNDTGCWEMTFDCSRPVPARYLQLLYRETLENYDGIWREQVGIITDLSGGAQTRYKCVVPAVYALPKMGFWKVGCTATTIYARMKIKATVSCLGTDGYMYKLTWPEGGGAVIAVPDDNED